jgi:predicted kinase
MNKIMKKSTLYIIHGFLGSGKTTFSKKLSLEIGAVHMNPDEWCVKLFDKKNYEHNWEKCFDETVNILWEKVAEYLTNGTDVIFDMGFWDRQSRNHAKSIAIKYNSDFKHYYIYVPDDIAKERILSRSGKIAENNVRNFDEIKKLFSEPDVDEDVIIINNY